MMSDTASAQTDLRVMSFNVRCAPANDGINNWANRRELCLKTIRDWKPDLLGTQEAVETQYEALVAGLPEMQIVGVARDDGKRKGEWSALLFRPDRFELIDSGTFWLSETPDVPGSRSWDSSLPRICTWALLRDKQAGRELLCANTHLDHVGKIARQESARLIARKLPELARGAPVILMGDFNAYEDESSYAALTSPLGGFIDTYRQLNPTRGEDELTYHAYTGKKNGSRIDYILHTNQLRTVEAQIMHTPATNGVYPSDHYPITAIVGWK